jgi:predicted nucleotidyltransferase
MAVFEFRSAQELGRIFEQYGVKYLFFGKSGAILLGYSDTTQDVDFMTSLEANRRQTVRKTGNLYHVYCRSGNG